MNREQTTADDGSVTAVFRHIFFPEGERRYVSTWARWIGDSLTPQWHFSRALRLTGCFTMTPDKELWTLDLGAIRYAGDEIHSATLSDSRASYFYAPTRLLGDGSDATEIAFEKKSSGGSHHLSGYYESTYGDIVLKNGAMRASYEIPEHCTGEWRQFRAPLDGPGWRLQGGATSIADVLENVTMFQIRAEYGYGVDTAAIRDVVID